MGEPIAWMEKTNLFMLDDFEFPVILFKNKPEQEGFIPLYTTQQYLSTEKGK